MASTSHPLHPLPPRIAIPIAAFAVLAALSSCGSSGKNPADGGPNLPGDVAILSPRTRMSDTMPGLSFVSISDNIVVYDFTGPEPDIRTGDILAGGAGYGFLRKVAGVSFSGGRMTAATADAALTDAVVKGKIDTTLSLDVSGGGHGGETTVLALLDGVSAADGRLDFTNVAVTEEAGGAVFSFTVTNGSLAFRPALDLSLGIENSRIQEFSAVARGALVCSLDLRAEARNVPPGGASLEKETTLASFRTVARFFIGTLPVVEVVHTEVIASFRGTFGGDGSVETGFDQNAGIALGGRFRNGAYEWVWEPDPASAAHTPVWTKSAGCAAAVSIRTVATVKFYGAAGPRFEAVPFLSFDGRIGGDAPWEWGLAGGIGGSAGFDVSVLGAGIEAGSKSFPPQETVIASDYAGKPKTYSIRGAVLINETGLPGVGARVKGAGIDTMLVTGSGGNYLVGGLLAGDYTLTPSLAGYTFVPPSKTFGNLAEDAVQDFTASRIPTVPSIPSNLTAVAVSPSRIDLSWTDNSPDELGFRIERRQGTGQFAEIGTVPADSTSFSSPGLAANTEYSFRVRAYTAAGNSAYSNTASAWTASGGPPVVVRGISFVPIPGGTFPMGDEIGDLWSGCGPPNTVTVSSFFMSGTEITNAQYCAWLNEAFVRGELTVKDDMVPTVKEVKTGHPLIYLLYSYGNAANCWIRFRDGRFVVEDETGNWPVVCVSWYGAKAFAEAYGWDIPREAEWEYACRGGRRFIYGTDDGTLDGTKANYRNAVGHPVDVKSYPPNPWGLSDMSGNVWEWCADRYGRYLEIYPVDPKGAPSGEYHILRGGSWFSDAFNCRSAMRSFYYPDDFDIDIGFRVVLRGAAP